MTIGYLQPAAFTIPQNPITLALQNQAMAGLRGFSGGMGDAVTDSITNWLDSDSPIPGVSNVLFWGGAVAAVFIFMEFKGSKYSYSRGGKH